MGRRQVRACWLVVAGAVLAGAYALWACWFSGTLASRPVVRAAAPQDFQIRVLTDVPGVDFPRFDNISKVAFSAQAEVVGVDVNGLARAYPLSLLKSVDNHIVNDLLDGKPLSITYCNLADRVRVLTWNHRGYRIPLSVGGLDENRQMLLVFGDEERFRQDSKSLPLDDHPFARMTLGEWSSRHPRSLVFVGAAE